MEFYNFNYEMCDEEDFEEELDINNNGWCLGDLQDNSYIYIYMLIKEVTQFLQTNSFC